MNTILDDLPALSQNNNRDDFPAKAAGIFRIMKPFNDYLNKALAEFQMPAR